MITPDFTAYALRAHARYSHPLSSELVRRMVEGTMTNVTLECVKEGADLIGHIKSVIETDGKGFLACSVLESSGAVQVRGKLEDGITEIEIVLNVLLYGLKREKVAEITERIAKKELGVGAAQLDIEDLKSEHAHPHHHQ